MPSSIGCTDSEAKLVASRISMEEGIGASRELAVDTYRETSTDTGAGLE